jgi:hypothetical protein
MLSGDLVAHARVAVFHVVALRISRAPQLVQVAGHAARRGDDDVARLRDAVDDADHLALRGQRAVAQTVSPLDRPVPFGRERACPLVVLGIGAPVLERLGQRFESSASVGEERQPCLLERVDGSDVEIDEPDAGVLEDRP